MQCCTCSKRIHLRCSFLSFSRFKTLSSSHFWSCPPCFFWRSHSYQHCDFLLELLQLAYLHCATWPIWPPVLMCSSALPSSSNLLSPFCPPRIFSRSTFTTVSCSWMFFYISCLLFPLTPLGFFNGMLEVSDPGALNYYTLFCLILLTLFVCRNLTLTHLPLSGFLGFLLCVLIAPTPGLTFSLPISRMLAAASSFSSGRACPSLNFLPPLFLRSIPTLIM